MPKPLNQSALKKFRAGLSILKKKGIVSNIDVRTAQPWMIRGGKKLGEQVKKFDDVISNKAEAVKLPQKKLREYKKAGYETMQGRVIVPKLAHDKVTVEKGEIKITDKKTGFAAIKKAVPYHNMEQWLHDFQKDSHRINMMKRKNEWFAFTIGESHSHQAYRDIGHLIDDLSHYQGLNDIFFKNFEIVRIPDASKWPGVIKGYSRQHSPTSKKARRAWLKRTKNTPMGEERRRKAAERQKAYRAAMKGSQLKEYRKDAAKRAKQSRKRHSKKKK